MKIQQLSSRQIYLIIFLAVGGLIGYAAYSIKILGLEPCPLCITQQFFYSIVGITAFIAFNHNPVEIIKSFLCCNYFSCFSCRNMGSWSSSLVTKFARR